MKKIIRIILTIFILTISITFFCWAKYYAADFMTVKEAEKKWGIKMLDKKLFREGDPTKRASMSVDKVKDVKIHKKCCYKM